MKEAKENDLKLVLASASPRREAILKQLKLKFTVVPSKIDESEFKADNPVELVEILAVEKAKAVAKLVENVIIIAADTVVVADDQILGKPKNKIEAKKMLKKLSGQEHQVITGLAVLNSVSDEVQAANNITEVKMSNITEVEIEKYIEQENILDKAGSYAIQGLGGIFVEEIKGSYYSVMGMPIHQLAKLLKEFNYGIL
ncbi:Maf family protein [Halanaerobium praevalens]|uniref:dTTP/UTP pyrophosphatase n=1 Tax=Halanaerobium praevalens (strain ATCC 33744 / DSM 2228 / GSL) TaxID=572479 RepID=E3DMG6_HALPG|nr:Maf family protein [Halanaerobium praevalens]ADO77374.1 maf protein [Halanaerobium praevalens DSM 2228]